MNWGGLYSITDSVYVGTHVVYTNAILHFDEGNYKKKMDMSGVQIGLVVGYAF